MRLLIFILFFASLGVAEIPMETNTIFDLDPSLEAYTLQEEKDEEDSDLKAILNLDELRKPATIWRLLGWGTYLACGSNIVASQYRKERTYGPYSPFIDNDVARAFTLAGAAEGANMGSEWFRNRNSTNPAWMARIGAFVSCGYAAISNFRNGWKRR